MSAVELVAPYVRDFTRRAFMQAQHTRGQACRRSTRMRPIKSNDATKQRNARCPTPTSPDLPAPGSGQVGQRVDLRVGRSPRAASARRIRRPICEVADRVSLDCARFGAGVLLKQLGTAEAHICRQSTVAPGVCFDHEFMYALGSLEIQLRRAN